MIMGRTRTNTSIPGEMCDLHTSPKRISFCWPEVYLLDAFNGAFSSISMVAAAGSPDAERSGTLHILM